MKRKEELEVLLAHAKKKVEKNLDDTQMLIDEYVGKLKTALVKLGVDQSVIKSIRISDNYSYVTVAGPNGKDSDITMYHKSNFGTFSLGWYSSRASDTEQDIHFLHYLEVIGIIAKDTRTEKTIEAITEAFQNEYAPIRQEYNALSFDEYNLRMELARIKEEEIDNAILSLGKLTFKESIREYVQYSVKRKFVKYSDKDLVTFNSVEIKSSTNSFMTLLFKNKGPVEVEKKLKKQDALKFLRKIYIEHFQNDNQKAA